MHLDQLNAATPAAFAAGLTGVIENAPWVAQATASARPFATIAALHDALMATIRAADQPTQLAFLCGHPDLSPKALTDPAITPESRAEQGGLGFASLGADIDAFSADIAAYRQRFGFPFIICVRRHTAASCLRMLRKRAGNDPATEQATALAEIGYITRLRLVERVTGPGAPRVSGHLSTHVLDTGRGRAGAGMRVEMWREGVLVRSDITDKDGRVPGSLVEDEPLRIGRYELRFYAGEYAEAQGADLTEPFWYDVIPINFGISEPEGHYHVPLLLAPWSYTTYRGS